MTHTICVDIARQVDEIPKYIPDNFEFTVIEEEGPAGGWPFIEVRAPSKEELKRWYCVDFCGDSMYGDEDSFEKYYFNKGVPTE